MSWNNVLLPTQSALNPMLLIDGKRRPATGGVILDTINPSTGEILGTIPAGSKLDIDEAVTSAKSALEGPWRSWEPKERQQCLFSIAAQIRANLDELVKLECLDAGKPVSSARKSVIRAADYFVYFGSLCDKIQGTTIPRGTKRLSFTQLEPVGITGHITPWNVPLTAMARGIAPALACGNTAVVKPAEQASLSTLLLIKIMQDAGLPAGVCNAVTGLGETAGSALANHPLVNHITFTGSVSTGKVVMQAAANHIAEVTLELGGKSPIIVLPDADIEQVVKDVIRQLHTNAGQICSAGTRLVIDQSVHQEVRDRIVAQAELITIGPAVADPQMGPLISMAQRDRVEGFVEDARTTGLTILTGGTRPSIPGYDGGYYYKPTVIDNVPVDHNVAQSEIFGPVLCIQPVDGIEQAVSVANSTPYGLAAAVYTRDISCALTVSRDLQAGQVFINEYQSAGDTVPFGGVKQSGIGREKGLAAIANYTVEKSVTARVEW